MRFFLILIIIVSFLFNISCGNDQSIETAKKYFKAGDFQKACELFQKNIEKHKNGSEEIMFYLAVCNQKLGKNEKALEYYDIILSDDFRSEMKSNEDFIKKLEVERNSIILELGYEYGIKGEFEKSSGYLQKVIKDYAELQYHLARIAFRRKEYRKASGLLETAINARGYEELKKNIRFTLDVYFEKALLYKELYSVTRAEEDFLESYKNIRLASNLMLDVHVPEDFRIRINELKRSLTDFPIFTEKYEKIEKAFDDLRIYERGKEWKNIAEKARVIIDNSPVVDDKVYAGIKLGDAYLELGEKDNAIKAYREALDNAEKIRTLSKADIEERILEKFRKLGLTIDKK